MPPGSPLALLLLLSSDPLPARRHRTTHHHCTTHQIWRCDDWIRLLCGAHGNTNAFSYTITLSSPLGQYPPLRPSTRPTSSSSLDLPPLPPRRAPPPSRGSATPDLLTAVSILPSSSITDASIWSRPEAGMDLRAAAGPSPASMRRLTIADAHRQHPEGLRASIVEFAAGSSAASLKSKSPPAPVCIRRRQRRRPPAPPIHTAGQGSPAGRLHRPAPGLIPSPATDPAAPPQDAMGEPAW
ncbi:hypothetical protein U9M48_044831 [Paspalum notatum var. saurae]|uniref:Uncharacterized protein n=1 Tax=Paspalum notatum var. saurae TaxID=547442 RepID=A0AAQ3V0F4_PASNO